jgi:CubicO group peptidase (beta-lactamase class C family)
MSTFQLFVALSLAGSAFTSLQAATAVKSDSSTGLQVQRALRELRPSVQVQGRTYKPESIAELMRRHQVPAVSIAVLRGNRIAWSGAFGVADSVTRRAATTDTLFQAASISKPVAASAALRLVEQGQLSLDAPVNARLKSWRIADSAAAKGDAVTLRHLLTHTAGLTVHGFGGYRPGTAIPSVRQVLDGTAPANSGAVRLKTAPGSEWRYSGGGFTVLQLMLTDATGRSFADLMTGLVLRPAGMTRSSFVQSPPATVAMKAAVAHLGNGKPVPGRYHHYPEMAAAGLWTTPSDLARWAGALGAAYNGEKGRLLSPAMARQMLTSGKGDWGLGLGVRREGETIRFSHSGANEGFRSLMIVDPVRGDGLVLMANSDSGGKLFGPLIQAMGGLFGWPEARARVLVPAAISDEERASILGRYEGGPIVVEVALQGNRLMATQNGSETFELISRGNDVFVAPDIGLRIEFVRDDKTGRISELKSSGATLKRTN